MEPVESFDYKHHRVDIFLDEDGGNPRDADNLGIMYCEHRSYVLGDMPDEFARHIPEIDEIRSALREVQERGYSFDRLVRYLRWTIGATTILPLYLFDHSGLAMSTCAARFAAWDAQRWDWGQVGLICDSARTRELIGVEPAEVEAQLLSEVEQYDAYLHGQVYGYTVTNIASGIEVDSCWGFLVTDEKDMECMRDEARAAA